MPVVRLPLTVWGDGPRTAALVHGYSDDARTWQQVAPALAARGWQVLAPDLTGHGSAPRAARYSLPALAADLVDSLPEGPDLLLGHSLGALLVNLIAHELCPRRTVLVDPPWGPLPRDLARTPSAATPTEIATSNPRWSHQDVMADVASNQLLDPQVSRWLATDPFAGLTVSLPVPPVCPTTVVVPADGALAPADLHPQLRQLGFDVLVVPGVGHVVHRDDPAAWLAAVTREQLAA